MKDFNNKYNTQINFLDYGKITSAIPRDWKIIIKKNFVSSKNSPQLEILKIKNLSNLTNKKV